MYTVAVSYLEWIRWIATGWFRCSDRVVWVDGTDDQQGVDALMDRTPDLQVSDDQGYLIACLKPDALRSGRQNGRERSVGHLWLKMAAVSSFHPLSLRGMRLLEADADRAAVQLGQPIFEKAWSDWRDRQIENEAHWRGLSLCTALGLHAPDFSKVPFAVYEILSGASQAPNAVKSRDNSLEGTRAFGWAAALSVALLEPRARSAVEQSGHYNSVKAMVKGLNANFEIQSPLLEDVRMMALAYELDVIVRDVGIDSLPISVMAAVLHYRNLALTGRNVSLPALINDFTDIALEDPQNASLSAYCIGRCMENVAVSTLLYQSDPGSYTVLTAAAGLKRLDVMALAAEKLETKQAIEQVQQVDLEKHSGEEAGETSNFNDANSGLNEVEVVPQVVEDRSHNDHESSKQFDVDGKIPASEPSPQSGPKSETPITDTTADSKSSTEANKPMPSTGFVDELSQVQKLDLELKADFFQQDVVGLEPVSASAKSKKKRGNTDKTAEIGPAFEMTDNKSKT